ncbi:MAG: alpha/beta hydrolase [Clostridia bacterium]|nr:alpha/beta hydrolase [Clostridia bacterium]
MYNACTAYESAHYKALFPACEVTGIDYRSNTPWEAGEEIRAAVEAVYYENCDIILIANSIGAYFAMHAHIEPYLKRAFFISPVVDMEALIGDLMRAAQVSEAQLQEQGTISTAFGEDLSWEYLCFVRAHPLRWHVPTAILYGERDTLTSLQAMKTFAAQTGASFTIMKGGEHWFHTPEQMRFLDNWITHQKGESE